MRIRTGIIRIIAALAALALLCGCSDAKGVSERGYSGKIAMSATANDNGEFVLTVDLCEDNAGVGGLAVKNIVADINSRQSLDVDVIAGATESSAAAIAAAEKALKKAGLDVDELKERANFSNIETEKLECDVLIVGAGGAGLTAAIAAAEKGMSVIVLEKMGIAGGTTALSDGYIMASDSLLQRQNLIKDSSAGFASYLFNYAGAEVDSSRLVDMAEHSAGNLNMLLRYNVVFSPEVVPIFEGQEPARNHIITGNGTAGGGYLIKPLLDAAEAHGVRIIYNAEVFELNITASGKVTGAKAKTKNGGRINVTACSTVLATGGYSQNEALMKSLAETEAADAVTATSLGVTGDGIELARSAGAIITNGAPIGELYNSYGDSSFGLFVTPKGDRFCDESGDRFAVSGALYETGFRKAYYITSKSGGQSFSDAVKEGVIIKASSVKELGDMLKAPNLAKTVERYDELCGNKSDTDFGKSAVYMKEIGNGSEFYAVPLTSKVYGTTGGVKTNIGCVVMSEYGPIDGLYAAGEITNGGYFAESFPGFGASIAEVVETGRTAGSRAAQNVLRQRNDAVFALTEEYYSDLLDQLGSRVW